MHTRKRSLEEAAKSPPPTPPTNASAFSFNENNSVIEPSMLRLLTPESTASPPSTPGTCQDLDQVDEERPKKKQRSRRNAKTEEEKKARAEERALRNRRAAQESRDRKRQLFEALEKDNERLRMENLLLKEKLASLECRVTIMESTDSVVSGGDMIPPVKEEVGEKNEIAQAHYPAVSSDFVLPFTSSVLSRDSRALPPNDSMADSFALDSFSMQAFADYNCDIQTSQDDLEWLFAIPNCFTETQLDASSTSQSILADDALNSELFAEGLLI